MTLRGLRIALSVAAALGVASGLVVWQARQAALLPAQTTPAAIGGPFRLTAHDGRTVTDTDFRGRWLLIYFGYTYCPDVCPTSLYAVGQALDRLGPAADQIQPMLITVDPERDTPELLRNYVGLFHPRLIGLTGPADEIAAVAKAYRVYFAKVQGAADSPYLMDHSTSTYLVGPDGTFVTVFGHGTSPEQMADTIKGYLDRR